MRLDLLKKNFLLSVTAAAVGILTPIGLSYLLMYQGYGYGKSLDLRVLSWSFYEGKEIVFLPGPTDRWLNI